VLHRSKTPRREGAQVTEVRRATLAVTRITQSSQNHSPSDDIRLQRSMGNRGMMLLAHPQKQESVRVEVNRGMHLAKDAQQRIAVDQLAPSDRIMKAPVEPYVRQVHVDLNRPQRVSLDWQGTPPTDARSNFRCSTGKGYGDPDDPVGICTRACCTPGVNPCESPYDQKRSTGSCCTPIGDFVIQSKERDHAVEGGTISFWMYFYRNRGIALHEYSPVDGTPLSHGCVRLDSVNAEMLFNHSYVGATQVTVAGTATPACPAGQGVACTSASAQPGRAADALAVSVEREEVDAGA
jgi:L,D-transpeptidase catalytic domain